MCQGASTIDFCTASIYFVKSSSETFAVLAVGTSLSPRLSDLFKRFFAVFFVLPSPEAMAQQFPNKHSNTSVVEVCFVVEGEKSRISMDLRFTSFFFGHQSSLLKSQICKEGTPPLTPTPGFWAGFACKSWPVM